MPQKLTITNVRFSYVHVFQPHKFEGDEDKEPRYSVTILVPKKGKDGKPNPEVKKIEDAIGEAYKEARVEKWANKTPAKWFNPLQDGDEPNADGEDRGEAYHDCYFLNAKSRQKPGLVDKKYNQILNTEEFYSGCYGHVSVAFSGFDNKGNKGISCFLNNIMKTQDGDPLGSGSSSPEDDFAGLGEEDDEI